MSSFHLELVAFAFLRSLLQFTSISGSVSSRSLSAGVRRATPISREQTCQRWSSLSTLLAWCSNHLSWCYMYQVIFRRRSWRKWPGLSVIQQLVRNCPSFQPTELRATNESAKALHYVLYKHRRIFRYYSCGLSTNLYQFLAIGLDLQVNKSPMEAHSSTSIEQHARHVELTPAGFVLRHISSIAEPDYRCTWGPGPSCSTTTISGCDRTKTSIQGHA